MIDDTTIIIITKNNANRIKQTIKELELYAKKYRNIKEVIIHDNASFDGTPDKIIKSSLIKLIRNFRANIPYKKMLLEAITEAKTNNIIILEPELNTRLHQIQRQIKKLRKSDLIIPNRHDKESTTKYADNKEELKSKAHNLLMQTITGLGYKDTHNINKALRKNKILPILKRTKNKEYYWEEAINKCKKKNMRITETPTHYIQESKQPEELFSIIIKTIKELNRIRRIK